MTAPTAAAAAMITRPTTLTTMSCFHDRRSASTSRTKTAGSSGA
ncbi:hypothetical protein [Streptomyces xanthochromogenes]